MKTTTFLNIIICLAVTFLLRTDVYAEEHIGDIILTGNQTMVIENTTYKETGNILVSDSARLTVRNATLIINQRYHEEFRIDISGNGTLEVISSTIDVSIPGENVLAAFYDNATAIVQNSNLRKGRVYFQFPGFNGNASIYNSALEQIELTLTLLGGGKIFAQDSDFLLTLRFRDNYVGEFSNLKPGSYDWYYSEGNYKVDFRNTSLRGIIIACDGPSEVTVYKSEIVQFAPTAPLPTIHMKAVDSIIHQLPLHGLRNITAQFWGLKTGLHSYWTLRDHSACDSLPELVLENTEILLGWYVNGWGNATLNIHDSVLDRLTCANVGNELRTTNSSVNEMMLYSCTDSFLYIENSTIQTLNVYVPPNSLTVGGTITFPEGSNLTNWYSPSIIKRNYPVFLMNEKGKLNQNASLYLYSKSGNLVWSGKTDENGRANFDIEFNDNNHSDTWKLEIGYNGKKFVRYITLLTSTPIQIYSPNIKVEPTSIGFANLSVGASSSRVVTIKNAGNIGLIIGTITSPPPPFYKINDNCSGRTLLTGGNCSVTLKFSPTSAGYFNGTFDVPSNDPDESVVTVLLGGIATLPGSWLTPPYQNGTDCISMVTGIATDLTPPVSYYFDFVGSPTGGLGGADSGWQPATSYTNCNLRANHKYGYRVKAKDGLNNETTYSTVQYAYTAIEAPTGITFGAITSTSIQARSTNTPSGLSRGSSGLWIENTTNGTNSGWKRDNTFWTSKPLLPNTSYSFRAKARNGDGVETPYCDLKPVYTRANLPGRASFSDLARTSIRANWTANGNPPRTEYFCENVTARSNSGWITDISWISDNLTCGISYSFRVKARNGDGTVTGWTSLGSQSTVKCVTLLTPNGGEMISSGSSYDIQWDPTPEAVSFDLFYSLDNGVSWLLIKKDVRNTIHSWPVPKTIGNKKACFVRVIGYNGARTKRIGYDTSDKPFTIEVVTLITPNGGELLHAGDPLTIEWRPCVDAVKFDLTVSFDSGVNWRYIDDKSTPEIEGKGVTGTTLTTKVPSPGTGNSKTCFIKVIAYNGAGKLIGSDTSDKPFTIEVVKLTSPNGGETLKQNDTINDIIRWTAYETSEPVTKVQLFYTKDAGTTWNLIPGPSGTTYPPGNYSQSWTIPPVGTTEKKKCKVKVVLKDAKGVIRGSDVSDNYFTIEP